MSEVYADILDSLTTGLYNDVKFAVREYLQNAYDAIKQAKAENLPLKDDVYRVDIDITRNNKIITIADNGVGMDLDLIKEYTSIGGGTKNSPELAGYKGIGKLSGLRFFNEFQVISKMHGSSKANKLSWKCGEMMKILRTKKDKIKRTPYKDFISEYYTIEEIDGRDTEEHYTQVQLIDVVDEFQDQISEQRIGNYIKQNCPVPFFEGRFKYADKILNWMGKDLEVINTLINGKVIYQIYTDEYELAAPQLVEIKYDDKVRAKAWYSWIRETAETIENDGISGIRFRCKGLGIGDSNLFSNNCMPGERSQLANWFTGEIIVTDDDIKPSAARDRFIEGGDTKRFYSELRNSIGKELNLIADTRSEINAAETECNIINELRRREKPIPVTRFRKINDRIKKLERHKDRDKYGFNFDIIDKLKSILSSEEEHGNDELTGKDTEVDETLKKGPAAIIDRLIELKGKEVNTFSKKAKANINGQMDLFRQHLLNLETQEKVEVPDINRDFIIRLLTKYLQSRNLTFDKNELSSFVENELQRR